MNNVERHIQAIKSIQLSPGEHSLMRHKIEYFMDQNPAAPMGLWQALTTFTRFHVRTIGFTFLAVAVTFFSYNAYQVTHSPERQMERDISQLEQQMQRDEQLAADLGW
jgi:hypothetical protein